MIVIYRVKWVYSSERQPLNEHGWVMIYNTDLEGKGRRYLVDNTGMLLVQRNLWFPDHVYDSLGYLMG